MRARNYAKFQNKQYLGNSTTVKESTNEGKKQVEFFSGVIDTVIVRYKSYQRWVQGKSRSKKFTRG